MAQNFGAGSKPGKKRSQYLNPIKHPQTYARNAVPTVGAGAAGSLTPDFRDSIYNDVVSGGQRGLANTQAYVGGQQNLLRNRYGYLDDSFTIDPSNPYGQAQLLKRSFDQSREGTQNSYAARGQMTSGAYGRMQAENLNDYGQRNNALQLQYLSDNAALINQLTQAQDDYSTRIVPGAASDALGRAISSGAGAVSTDPIVRTYFDAKGNKVNVHQSGRAATIKKRK